MRETSSNASEEDMSEQQARFNEIVNDAMDAPVGDEIIAVCLDIAELLIAKNRAYGNSALEPLRIFSKASPEEQILVRMDDKLSRIKTATEDDREDAYLDLVGYLILHRVSLRM